METKTKGFSDAWRSLPMKHAITIRNELLFKNGWTPQLWNHKITGARKPTLVEVTNIESVFATFGVNPWTGKKIRMKSNSTTGT